MPKYTLEKIQFNVDSATFQRAVGLYEGGKVQNFKSHGFSYSALVQGSESEPYHVVASERRVDEGTCNCYLGQEDVLCKHIVAVSIYAILKGRPIPKEAKEVIHSPKCSMEKGELLPDDLSAFKLRVSEAMKCIRSYTGPSRTWFRYQALLSEGCARLAKALSKLPVSQQTADLVVKILLRLDKKLSEGGVDDSDGTVGGFIEDSVAMLLEFAKVDTECIKAFKKLEGVETCFDWEDPLVELLQVKS